LNRTSAARLARTAAQRSGRSQRDGRILLFFGAVLLSFGTVFSDFLSRWRAFPRIRPFQL
jgi:type II secretory pathway component PulM